MKKYVTYFMLVVFCLMIMSPLLLQSRDPIRAADLSITVEADKCYIPGVAPDHCSDGQATWSELFVGHTNFSSWGDCKTALLFPLSSITSGIKKAELCIYIAAFYDYPDRYINVYGATGISWTDSDQIWPTQGATILATAGPYTAAYDPSGTYSGQLVKLDVTSYVQARKTAGDPKVAFILTGDGTAERQLSIHDKNYDGSHKAYLDITYTQAPAATTNAATSLSSTGATLNGTINARNLASTVTFNYGTTTAYGTTVNATPNTVSGATDTSVSANLTGLVPNTTYHYRVSATNSDGTTDGSDGQFTTSAAAPTVTTGAAGTPTATGVTLNGTVNANNASSTVTFRYGTSSGSYPSSATATQSPVTGTTGTAVSATLSGLTPGTTYYYVVRGVNAGGTTDGLEGTFTTDTSAPTATTNAASGISSTGATLNGSIVANGLSTDVTFQYGSSTSYGTTVTATPATASGTSSTAVSYVLSGLTPNSTYHYRVVGQNSKGTTNGLDGSFNTSAVAPTVTTGTAGTPTATGVTLNGTVNANNSSTTVTFRYGTASGGPYPNSATASENPVTGSTGTAVSCSLSGLTPSTTYYFIVRGVNGTGTTDGLEGTFTTAGAAPAVTTDAASSLSTTGATLNATVNPNNASTAVTFEYGTDTGYGTTVTADGSPLAAGTAGVGANKAITGLIPNTTYHYRVVATNATGTTNGLDQSFTTPAAAPTMTTNAATAVSSTGAQLNGTVNPNNSSTTVTFRYGTANGGPYPNSVTAAQSPVNGVTASDVSCSLSGLTPSTTYYYIVRGVNGGGTTDGLQGTFTTAGAAPAATTDAASAVTTTGATLNATVNPNNASTTVTFEYGPDTGYGTTVTATGSPLAAGTVGVGASKAIIGLTPNTTYHYRVIATNATGTTNGLDQSFTTPANPPTVTTNAATGISSTGAQLNGTVNAQNASTAVTFRYGTASGGPYPNTVTASQSPLSGVTDSAVSYTLSGLIPSTTYYYIARGVNSGGTVDGLERTFTTAGASPAVTTDAASSVSASGATLNATVNPNNASTTVTFEYGTTTGYGSTVTADGSPLAAGTTGVGTSKAVASLTPNTTYHYRVVATNATGTTNGLDRTFATPALAPTVTTNPVSALSSTGAQLNGTVNAQNASTTVTFQYGTTNGGPYPNTITAAQSPVTGVTASDVSCALTGLIPHTTYYYRAVGVSIGGSTNGAQATFTTPGAAPAVTIGLASNVTATSITLNGTVNPNNESTDVVFEYGTTNAYGTTVNASPHTINGTTSVPVSAALTGLTAGTTYHFRISATNATGTTNTADSTFTISSSDSDSGGPGGPGGPSGPTNTTTVTVTTTSGVLITGPIGVIPSNATIHVEVITSEVNPITTEGQFFASQVFDITLSTGSVSGTMQITLPFDPALIDRLTHTVTIQYFNESTHTWVTVPGCTINWASGLITGSINHLTEFAVVATPLNDGDQDNDSDNPSSDENNGNDSDAPEDSTIDSVTAPQFNDISGHWAENDIIRLASDSIVSGYPDGSFQPGKPITRAEFVVLIVKALKLEVTGEGSGFQDCECFWGDSAIAAACKAGLIGGYDNGNFGPNDPITREQVATIASKALGITPTDNDGAALVLKAYGDQSLVSPWAAGYVAAATTAGLMNGYEDGSFQPTGFTTRAEAVSIICRILDKI